VSERHACRLLGQWRGTQRYEVIRRTDEDALTRAIIELASEYGRYGYRQITHRGTKSRAGHFYDELIAQARECLEQEVARLGGHYAHVLDESVDSRHDDVTGEAWLHGRFTYMLYSRRA
jgi:hypothetical protein